MARIREAKMINNFITDLFSRDGFFLIVKILLVCLEVYFGAFAFIVIRQIGLMNKSFTTKYGSFFSFLSYIQFLFAIGLIILTIKLL